jgi:hypothetical protein
MGGEDGHSSGTSVAGRLVRPTRAAARRRARHPQMPAAPTWSCSRWGFPCRRRCRRRGALLPHRFTLAARSAAAEGAAVCFLWHCPWGRPRRALPGTVPPWSPDFPPPATAGSGHPTVWRSNHLGPPGKCQNGLRADRPARQPEWVIFHPKQLSVDNVIESPLAATRKGFRFDFGKSSSENILKKAR